MIVVDASAAILGLLNDGEARRMIRDEALVCPHLTDSEVAQTLRSLVLRGGLDGAAARRILGVWGSLGLTRLAVHGLLGRVWELRGNLTAYDATYVALAEELDVALVTADGRLSRAPGLRCTITLVRH